MNGEMSDEKKVLLDVIGGIVVVGVYLTGIISFVSSSHCPIGFSVSSGS